MNEDTATARSLRHLFATPLSLPAATVLLAILPAFAQLGSDRDGPSLVGSFLLNTNGSRGLEIARDGALTVVPNRPVGASISVELTFDEPLAAIRSALSSVGEITLFEIDPINPSRVTLQIAGVEDGDRIDLRFIDAVGLDSRDGVSDHLVQLGLLVGDFDPNGLINITDLFAFVELFTQSSPVVDIDGNLVINITDLFAFINGFTAPSPLFERRAPLIDAPPVAYAPPSEWSSPTPIAVRDDFTPTAGIGVSARSLDGAGIADEDIEVSFDGIGWVLRFRGLAGSAEIEVTASDDDGVSTDRLLAIISPPTAPEAVAVTETFLGVAPRCRWPSTRPNLRMRRTTSRRTPGTSATAQPRTARSQSTSIRRPASTSRGSRSRTRQGSRPPLSV